MVLAIVTLLIVSPAHSEPAYERRCCASGPESQCLAVLDQLERGKSGRADLGLARVGFTHDSLLTAPSSTTDPAQASARFRKPGP